jgi:hypothetical protein
VWQRNWMKSCKTSNVSALTSGSTTGITAFSHEETNL